MRMSNFQGLSRKNVEFPRGIRQTCGTSMVESFFSPECPWVFFKNVFLMTPGYLKKICPQVPPRL